MAKTIWASAAEIREEFRAATIPTHCGCRGEGSLLPCYGICPNSVDYYSPEREREDALYNDSLSYDEWFREAVAQYERVHGEAYCS